MENNYLTLERDEWLACRKGRFTASDIYRLFNTGTRPMTEQELAARPKKLLKDGTAGKVFIGGATVETMFGPPALKYIREKVDELISGNPNGEEEKYPSQSEFKQTEWGNSNEWDGLRRFEVITGKAIIFYGGSSPKFFPYGDYSGCSPDGDVVGENSLVEIKCPYDTDVHTQRLLYKTVQEFREAEKKEWCQCQAQMKIMGRDFAYFGSYDPRKSFKPQQMKIIKLTADLEWQDDFEKRLAGAIQEMKTMIDDTGKYLMIE